MPAFEQRLPARGGLRGRARELDTVFTGVPGASNQPGTPSNTKAATPKRGTSAASDANLASNARASGPAPRARPASR